MESKWNVYSDCGTLVLEGVSREEAFEKVVSGITDELHFTYHARQVKEK